MYPNHLVDEYYYKMHPVRRRKKRPNYGVRTVEVTRGKNGFGFTISGQHPCILSCIVAGSPAETAGLRAGDYLVAVDGQSVSKVPHDQVVRLIGCSTGVLKLQIAENYYSDSSDDDINTSIRQKPKYPHKYRSNCRNAVTLQSRTPKSSRDRSLFDDTCSEPFPLGPRRSLEQFPEQWKIPPPASRCLIADADRHNESEEELFRAIVGYVGTIEMPRKLPLGSRLQIVRGCIKKLRAEKRTHTSVLMRVMTRSLRLINGAGITLAVYPGERVIFAATSSDKDHKHFGVVTMAMGENPSSACHVFAIDSRPHASHGKRAKIFKLECQLDPDSGVCKEFPSSCDPIVNAIKRFYESASRSVEPVIANSPQPSHDSTTTTSNSDSGIGFRDDCGNQSDRILVVDVQNHQLRIHEMGQGGSGVEKLTVRSLSNPVPSRSRSPLSTESEGPTFLDDMSVSSGTTKSPDVTVVTKAQGLSDPRLRPRDGLRLSYKKMFSPSTATSHSLEDLKEDAAHYSLNHPSHWGSLQDLRNLIVDALPNNTTMNEEKNVPVALWASSFEKLLEDPNGIQIFAQFLKKEFSHENILFWVACERYREIENLDERREKAYSIYKRHLAPGAQDPVNVDAAARLITQDYLNQADPKLFSMAQKQIFNLMKFDSYPRFIKSDIYQSYAVKSISGERFVIPNENPELLMDFPQPMTKLKKSRSDAEDSRRKSLLPWTRKNRAKSRDRGDIGGDGDSQSVCSSRSSLTAWEINYHSGFCRVMLPDGSSAVIQVQPLETIRALMSKLLDKRAISYSHFQIFRAHSNNKEYQIDEDSTVLSGQEVRIEIKGNNDGARVESNSPVSNLGESPKPMSRHSVDSNIIKAWSREDFGKGKSLDEITNRVFEELLKEKSDAGLPPSSDQGSVRSDDWGSENSSGILGRFLRRDSAFLEKQRKLRKGAKQEEVERKPTLSKLPPLIAKLKPGSKLETRSESDVLYEGLKRAQRCRLEDQRGTEINFELPDFLKDKENAPLGGKKIRKNGLEADEDVNNGNDSIIKSREVRKDLLPVMTDVPPPLPPKPKNYPSSNLWAMGEPRPPRPRPNVYLDQPGSSIV